MMKSLKVLSLSLCLVLAGATAFACGAKASGESLGGGAVKADKSSCTLKSGEALGGSAMKADKAGCATKSSESLGGGVDKAACPYKSGESLGGSAVKADKAGCADKADCPVKSGESLGGGADKAACPVKSGESLGGSAVKASCPETADCPKELCEALGGGAAKADCANKADCPVKSGEALGGSGAEKITAAIKSDAKDDCCPAAKSNESLGGSTEKIAAAGELKACCPGCEGKIAKGEKPECCVKAALGGGAETKDAGMSKMMKEGNEHPKSEHPKTSMKKEMKSDEALGGSAEAGASAFKVGDTISDMTLIEAVSGAEKSLANLAGSKATALIFWNQECPFVVDVQNRINEFHKAYSEKGVKVVALDAGTNNANQAIATHAQNFDFPILINKDTTVAAKFGATRTPEVFLLDSNMNILYHGAFDSGTFQGGIDKPESNYVITFVDNMLAGKANDVTQTKPFGCSLKYASGVKPLK